MGKNLPQSLKTITPFVGKQVLSIITSGMYDNPLMILREFIQNSVDAIDEKYGDKASRRGIISINVNGKDRSIIVTDNGCGIKQNMTINRLVDIGNSYKEGQGFRGFRGIGRLGALAYADVIRFETRSSSKEPVSIVEWSGKKLRQISNNKTNFNLVLEQCIQKVVKVDLRKANCDDPVSFFKVSVLNINPFHKDELMNISKIKDYLCQVAPVSMDKNFKFVDQIKSHLKELKDYSSYNIFLNGKQLFRPLLSKYAIKKGIFEEFKDVEFFDFKNGNGDKIAYGWYAKTDCLAAVPKETLMRGIRIRKGNIEIGDEYYLQGSFTEARFAFWHIGELHVAVPSIKENARRDGFEQSSDFELFLEKCNILGRHLSNLCRKYSKKRSIFHSITQRIDTLERLSHPGQIIINAEHQEEIEEYLENTIETLKRDIGDNPSLRKKLLQLEKRITRLSSKKQIGLKARLDGRALRHKENKEIIEEICTSVRRVYTKNMPVEDLLQQIVEPYL